MLKTGYIIYKLKTTRKEYTNDDILQQALLEIAYRLDFLRATNEANEELFWCV